VIYITKRTGIDDVVVGRITDKIESNDDELTMVVKGFASVAPYVRKGNKKYPCSIIESIKDKLYFPFGLTTNADVEFEIYRDTVYA
jgi:hypothetical protein